MNISENGLNFIKSCEGFRAVPKIDTGGKLVWGYGHNQQPGETVPATITEPEADALLSEDMNDRYGPQVSAVLKLFGYQANQNQFDALCSFCFNLGMGRLHEMLRHGWDKVPVEIIRWDFAGGKQVPGLLVRRQKELALFQTP